LSKNHSWARGQLRERFQPGTNLRAWLFTILRNIYYSNYRKGGRGVENELDAPADQLVRNRRRRMRPKTEIEHRHGKVIDVRPRHRLVQGLAQTNNDGAGPGQSVLEIYRKSADRLRPSTVTPLNG
jgi:hypothetical protein